MVLLGCSVTDAKDPESDETEEADGGGLNEQARIKALCTYSLARWGGADGFADPALVPTGQNVDTLLAELLVMTISAQQIVEDGFVREAWSVWLSRLADLLQTDNGPAEGVTNRQLLAGKVLKDDCVEFETSGR